MMIEEQSISPNFSYKESYENQFKIIRLALEEKKKVRLVNNRYVEIYLDKYKEAYNGVRLEILREYIPNVKIDENGFLSL